MPFSTYGFLLGFLPIAALAFHGLLRLGSPRGAVLALLVASLGFYASWNPAHLLVLVPLAVTNHEVLRRLAAPGGGASPGARTLLAACVVVDLGALAWFKYAGFATDAASRLLGLGVHLAPVALPLGISFFTFNLITSLVDAAENEAEDTGFLDYALFVSFFPYVASGPLVRHREIVPQLRKTARPTAEAISVAVTLLALGLAKKVLLADSAAPYASARFDAAAAGQALSPLDAWAGALAYTAQLYFDFSGYSDMAIGAALLFGIRLPVNFASPYKAESVIDFWRRWHITLSRFLREYVFTPLALRASRRGRARPYQHLVVTMLLCGLWHGAGFTYVVWGAVHGLYLAVNHAWRAVAQRRGIHLERHPVGRAAAWLVTFVAIVAAWVIFRASDLPAAGRILAAMTGAGGTGPPASFADTRAALAVAAGLLLLARVAPNTQELTGYAGPGEVPAERLPGLALSWAPSPIWAIAVGSLAALSLASLSRISEFIYFRF